MTAEQGVVAGRIRNAGIVMWTVIGGVILGYAAFAVLARIGSVLTPFLLAMLLVYILRPLVNALEARGVPRVLAVVLTYVVAIVIVTVALVLLVPVLVVQIQEFVASFPTYFKAASKFVSGYSWVVNRARLDANLSKVIEPALAKLQESGVQYASLVPAYTMSVFGLVLNLVMAPLIAFYLLKDLHQIRDTMLGLIPKRYRVETVHLMSEIDGVVAGFLRGQSLVALSVAVLSTIVLVVMRVQYAALLGLITGILSVIPYFGPAVGALIAGIVALFDLSPLLALLTVALLLGVQQIVNVSIAPYIMSQQVNVHPVVVIFALLVGGALFGVVGFVVAIPIAAIGKAIFVHFAEGHHERFGDDASAEMEAERS